MSSSIETFRLLVDSGKPLEMRIALSTLTEDERRSSASALLQCLKGIRRGYFSSPESYAAKPKLMAAAVGVLGTCSCSQILSQWSTISWLDSENLAQVLIDRRPPWIQEFIEAAFAKEISDKLRQATRRLIKAGLCERPQAAGYYLANFGWLVDGPVAERLKNQLDILEHDLWKFFEIEGKGEHSLAAHDKYLGARGDNSWLENIVAASAAGKVDRQRLFHASLEALGRDFTPYHAQWFMQLHESLKPTTQERASMLSQYLQLASSPAERTVSFSLDAMKAVHDLISENDKLPLIPRLLRSNTKTHALLGLRWFSELSSRFLDALTPSVLRALSHKHSQVQALALESLFSQEPQLLVKHLGELKRARDHIGVHLKAKLDELVLRISPENDSHQAAPEHSAPRSVSGTIVERIFNPLEIDWTAVSGALSPIGSLSDLVYACAELLGGDLVDTDLFLQVLDGFSRFSRTREPNFEATTEPLLRLERKPSADYSEVHCGFVDLLRTWRTGAAPAQPFQWVRTQNRYLLEDLYFWWCREVQSCILASKGEALFSTPTHRGGWIDPIELVRRAKQLPLDPEEFPLETSLGLLRLAPQGRPAALVAAQSLEGELGAALRYALGSSSEADTPGTHPQLWIAASRARSPFAVDPLIATRFPNCGADATEPARYQLRVEHERREYLGKLYHYSFLLVDVAPKTAAVPFLPTIFHDKISTALDADKPAAYRRGRFIGGVAMVRWLSTLWPLNPDPFLARGLPQVASNMKDGYVAPWNKHFLEPLLSPHRSINSEHAKFLILIALSSKDAGDASMAADTLIAAIQDGRLQCVQLGQILNTGLRESLMLSGRLAPRFREVALASAEHARVIFVLLDEMLQVGFDDPPHLFAALLEVFRDLIIAHGFALSAATMAALKRLPSTGKLRGVLREIFAHAESV